LKHPIGEISEEKGSKERERERETITNNNE